MSQNFAIKRGKYDKAPIVVNQPRPFAFFYTIGKMKKFSQAFDFNKLKTKPSKIWKALLAEFLGNLLLNFFGCASTYLIPSTPENKISHFILIALTFGLTIFVVVQALGHVSGAHINPAITAGMLATNNITIIKGVLYILMQCLGAITGSLLVKLLITDETTGVTTCAFNITELQGFGIEFLLGFVLVLICFGVCDGNKSSAKHGAALTIGMTVTVGHLAALQLTGSSMNPARSFGAALVGQNWANHWIYWVGPILGGICAAVLYKYVFSAPPVETVINNERNVNATEEVPI